MGLRVPFGRSSPNLPEHFVSLAVSHLVALSTEELMLLNCGAEEDSLESLGQQGDQTSQS